MGRSIQFLKNFLSILFFMSVKDQKYIFLTLIMNIAK